MELTATVASVLPLASGTSKSGQPWSKSTVIVKFMDGQYEQFLALDNMRNAENFAKLPIGQQFKFYFNVTSREFNGKWFTSATCWKWEPVAAAQPQYAQPQPQPQYAQPSTQQPQAFNIPPTPSPTNLPF